MLDGMHAPSNTLQHSAIQCTAPPILDGLHTPTESNGSSSLSRFRNEGGGRGFGGREGEINRNAESRGGDNIERSNYSAISSTPRRNASPESEGEGGGDRGEGSRNVDSRGGGGLERSNYSAMGSPSRRNASSEFEEGGGRGAGGGGGGLSVEGP